ncbi:hypothetical protein BC831DRAFT_108474, partial [Entophlyctis helioformis]
MPVLVRVLPELHLRQNPAQAPLQPPLRSPWPAWTGCPDQPLLLLSPCSLHVAMAVLLAAALLLAVALQLALGFLSPTPAPAPTPTPTPESVTASASAATPHSRRHQPPNTSVGDDGDDINGDDAGDEGGQDCSRPLLGSRPSSARSDPPPGSVSHAAHLPPPSVTSRARLPALSDLHPSVDPPTQASPGRTNGISKLANMPITSKRLAATITAVVCLEALGIFLRFIPPSGRSPPFSTDRPPAVLALSYTLVAGVWIASLLWLTRQGPLTAFLVLAAGLSVAEVFQVAE